jgi:hypothetical protein
MRAWVAVAAMVALAALATGCGKRENLIALKRLSKLVLQPRDMGPGFLRFDVGEQTFTDARRGPRFDPNRFGREGGWKARYRRTGSAVMSGPLVIESRADLFDSAGGAKKDLAAYDEEFRSTIAGSVGRRIDASTLGPDAVAISFRQGMVRYFRLAWRERNATGYVSVSGFEGRIDVEPAARLARKQRARMRRVD